MFVYCNGFWNGFENKTDGIHWGFFENLFKKIFDENCYLTNNIRDADILLESHFQNSIFFEKSWKYSIFFSGEGSLTLPNHSNQYTIILGAQETITNFVGCPLFLVYEYCKPFIYKVNNSIPSKSKLSSIISSPVTQGRYRYELIDELCKRGIEIDMAGHYKNNVGFTVPGSYFDESTIYFQSQYKIILALENTELDYYITEKIINPLRAGVIPIYFGSSKVNEYINEKRIIQVFKDNTESFENCINEIQKILNDDNYFLEKIIIII
jgi:hypothetical protein